MPGINKKSDFKSASEQKAKPTAETKTATRSKGAYKIVKGKGDDNQKRDELIRTGFHPTVVEFLKNEMGLDLSKMPLSTIYDIKYGRVTEPLEIKVKPLVYDREKGERVEAAPLKSISSLSFVFPYDNNYNPIALDDKHRVFVASYPCHDFIRKAEEAGATANVEAKEENKALPKFSNEQVMALEAIGINGDRLFSTNYNSLDVDTKLAIAAGEEFAFDGYVRTSFGGVNIAGIGKLSEMQDGTVRARFQSNEPVTQGKNDILDILSVRRIGSLELDIFERDSKGKMKTNEFDQPILNQAGKDLVNYGVAFEPVTGYTHKTEFDSKKGTYVNTIKSEKYQVTVINGGLCATAMKKVNDIDKDGNNVKTTFNGKEVDKYHYEVANARVNENGTVTINKKEVSFKTDNDLKNFKAGKVAVVSGAEWISYGEDKKGKKIAYDAVVYPDNQRNGFAKAFSPSTSERIISERQVKAQKKVTKPAKKQNFSLGF